MAGGTRLGKQHRENQSGSHDHNRPKPIPPTRGLLLCIGRWWSDFRFISCGLLAHFWDPIAIDELIPARFRSRISDKPTARGSNATAGRSSR
jgi:hypothetical protein